MSSYKNKNPKSLISGLLLIESDYSLIDFSIQYFVSKIFWYHYIHDF